MSEEPSKLPALIEEQPLPVREIDELRRALVTGPDRSVPAPTYQDRRASIEQSIKGYAGEVPEQYRVAPPPETLALDAPPTKAEERAIALFNSGMSPTEIAEQVDKREAEALNAVQKSGVKMQENPNALRTVVNQQEAVEWFRQSNPPQPVPAPTGGLFDNDLALQLREQTGCSLMECKRVLRETHGNIERALLILQPQQPALPALADATPEEVKIVSYLRDHTNAGKRECLIALRSADGDVEKARAVLVGVLR